MDDVVGDSCDLCNFNIGCFHIIHAFLTVCNRWIAERK